MKKARQLLVSAGLLSASLCVTPAAFDTSAQSRSDNRRVPVTASTNLHCPASHVNLAFPRRAALRAPGSKSSQRVNHLLVVRGKFCKAVLRGSHHVLRRSTAEAVVIELPFEPDHLLLDP